MPKLRPCASSARALLRSLRHSPAIGCLTRTVTARSVSAGLAAGAAMAGCRRPVLDRDRLSRAGGGVDPAGLHRPRRRHSCHPWNRLLDRRVCGLARRRTRRRSHRTCCQPPVGAHVHNACLRRVGAELRRASSWAARHQRPLAVSRRGRRRRPRRLQARELSLPACRTPLTPWAFGTICKLTR